MELSEIQTKILTPFVEETIKALDTMAGFKATAGAGFQDDPLKFKFKGYAVVAETSGAIAGKILMHHYAETALAIGNKVRLQVLGETAEATELNSDISEALAEFGNTAIGLATRSLTRANLGVRFRPPYLTSNMEDMITLLMYVDEILSIPIHVENVGRFYFNYLLHEKIRG